jgi:hypothetical protein
MWGMYILFPIMIINWNAYETRSDLFIECTKTIMILKEKGKHIISSKQIFFRAFFFMYKKALATTLRIVHGRILNYRKLTWFNLIFFYYIKKIKNNIIFLKI